MAAGSIEGYLFRDLDVLLGCLCMIRIFLLKRYMAVVHTLSALTVASAVFQPQLCLRAPAWAKRWIVEVLEAALYIPAQLHILQSLFEGRPSPPQTGLSLAEIRVEQKLCPPSICLAAAPSMILMLRALED
jgi:hypothetical protein